MNSIGFYIIVLLCYIFCESVRRLVQKESPVKFTIHEMRHTYCTRILREVAVKEAQYFMGHASTDMTLGVYNHMIASEELEPASERIRACL